MLAFEVIPVPMEYIIIGDGIKMPHPWVFACSGQSEQFS